MIFNSHLRVQTHYLLQFECCLLKASVACCFQKALFLLKTDNIYVYDLFSNI